MHFWVSPCLVPFKRVLGSVPFSSFYLKALERAKGARFSKVPIINGPAKLLLFTCKIEGSIARHLT